MLILVSDVPFFDGAGVGLSGLLGGAAARRAVEGGDAVVAHVTHGLDLVGVPQVRARVDGLDLADVAADVAVDLRAVDADEGPVRQRRPPGVLRRAVRALQVARRPAEAPQNLVRPLVVVLRRLLLARPAVAQRLDRGISKLCGHPAASVLFSNQNQTQKPNGEHF